MELKLYGLSASEATAVSGCLLLDSHRIPTTLLQADLFKGKGNQIYSNLWSSSKFLSMLLVARHQIY